MAGGEMNVATARNTRRGSGLRRATRASDGCYATCQPRQSLPRVRGLRVGPPMVGRAPFLPEGFTEGFHDDRPQNARSLRRSAHLCCRGRGRLGCRSGMRAPPASLLHLPSILLRSLLHAGVHDELCARLLDRLRADVRAGVRHLSRPVHQLLHPHVQLPGRQRVLRRRGAGVLRGRHHRVGRSADRDRGRRDGAAGRQDRRQQALAGTRLLPPGFRVGGVASHAETSVGVPRP